VATTVAEAARLWSDQPAFPPIISPATGARHYLHFEEIIGDGEREPIGVKHWPSSASAEGPEAEMPDFFPKRPFLSGNY
jgi:hypothetical protein